MVGRSDPGPSSLAVAGSRIERVDTCEGSLPPGAWDLGGRWVLPGLIDAHAHIEYDGLFSLDGGLPLPREGREPPRREIGYFVLARTARAFLGGGITTVRDVGSYDDDGIVLRDAIDLGITPGPRILSCGRIISATSPGGRLFGSMYREGDGPDEMRRAVREQIRRGADYIKLMATGARSVLREDPDRAQMTREEIGAIVEEAHRMGLRVAAHAEGLEGARLAVEEGVDTIEHGPWLHRAPEVLDRMAEAGTVLVPTLTTFVDLSERFADRFEPALVDQARRQREASLATVVAARAAGVTIAMGYDSGPPGTNGRELLRLIEAGLTASDAIDAATRGSARALGLEEEVGSVDAGKLADLVVVDDDPTVDPSALADPEAIWLVLRGGEVVAGSALAASPPW